MKLAGKSKNKSTHSTPQLSKGAADFTRSHRKSLSPAMKKGLTTISLDFRVEEKALKVVLPRPQSRAGLMYAGKDREMEAVLAEIREQEAGFSLQTSGVKGRVEKRIAGHRRSEALPKGLPVVSSSPPHTKSPYFDDRPTRTPVFGSEKLLISKRKKSLQSLKVSIGRERFELAGSPVDRLWGDKGKIGGSLESSGRRKSNRMKVGLDMSVSPTKRGIRRFEKVRTEARDYLDKLEDVMQHIRQSRSRLLVA